MIELCHELRLPFINWVVLNQVWIITLIKYSRSVKGFFLKICSYVDMFVYLLQKSSFKRFEICYVYRRPIGHSPPNRYLQVMCDSFIVFMRTLMILRWLCAVTQFSHMQGDFDVIGGASALTEAEVIKVLWSFSLHPHTH